MREPNTSIQQTIPLHDGNGLGHSLQLGSNRTGERKQSPPTDVGAHAHARARAHQHVLLDLFFAQQLSICQIQVVMSRQVQSHHDSCRPQGPQISTERQLELRLDHRRGWLMETLSVPSQVTGLAWRPSLCQPDCLTTAVASIHTWTCPPAALCPQQAQPIIYLSHARCFCGCADCRTACCGWLWPAVPLLRLTFCISRLPIMLYVSEGLPSWRVPRKSVAEAPSQPAESSRSIQTRCCCPVSPVRAKAGPAGLPEAHA